MIIKIKKIVHKVFFYMVIKHKLRKCGKKSFVDRNVECKYSNLQLGDYSSIGSDSILINSRANVIIGNYVMIAPRVTFVTGDHRYDIPGLYMQQIDDSMKLKENDCDIIVEDDVWIGTGSIILKGVTIGKGSIIGAGSVVTKNVPDYSIYCGNPAKFIKKRFTDEQLNLHEEKIKK